MVQAQDEQRPVVGVLVLVGSTNNSGRSDLIILLGTSLIMITKDGGDQLVDVQLVDLHEGVGLGSDGAESAVPVEVVRLDSRSDQEVLQDGLAVVGDQSLGAGSGALRHTLDTTDHIIIGLVRTQGTEGVDLVVIIGLQDLEEQLGHNNVCLTLGLELDLQAAAIVVSKDLGKDVIDDLGQLSGGGDLDITDGIEAGRLLQGDLQNFLGLSCGVGVVVFHGKILLKIFDLVLRSLV